MGAPVVLWFLDLDGDGFGGLPLRERAHQAVEVGGDCDDRRSDVHPGAPETCDGVDDDCDGRLDLADPDLVPGPRYFADLDADGFGDPGSPRSTCGSGVVANDGDCDDRVTNIHPGAPELCDRVDDDCDGAIDALDPDLVARTFWVDQDGDGVGAGEPLSGCAIAPGLATQGDDCDDADPSRSPRVVEVCNGIDDDCDGSVDRADDAVRSRTRVDADGDGHGGSTIATVCALGRGTAEGDDDCDDDDPDTHPDAPEVGDGRDHDCDGIPDL